MKPLSPLQEVAAATGLVDSHCHAFTPSREQGGLARQFSIAEKPLPESQTSETVLMHRLYRELGLLLGCPPDPGLVEAARREAYTADPAQYVRRLFTDAGYDWMLVDTGFPSRRSAGYDIDLAQFSTMLPCKVREVFRIEPLADALLEEAPPFDEFLLRYEKGIADALVSERVVALKSVIAYRTGLGIEVHARSEAKAAYERLRASKPRPSDEKTVRDLTVTTALDQAMDARRPLQLHAGMGDGPYFDMVRANPSLLTGLLAHARYREACLVLVHAGYPYVEETGWLANQYVGVYADISEMLPFAAHATKTKLLGLLEMAPITKVMFGSDGINAPEVHWFAALEGRAAVAAAASRLHNDGWLSLEQAKRMIRLVLRENALELYRLPADA